MQLMKFGLLRNAPGILLVCLMLLGAAQSFAQPGITVGVSILPQKYFVERIAGNKARVFVMVDAGHNPVTYEPKPKQIMQLQEAKLFFLIGVPFEARWAATITKANSQLKVIPLPQNLATRFMSESIKFSDVSSEVLHSGAHEHTHTSSMMDPHVWLNPILVKQIAARMLSAIIAVDSVNRDYYELNYQHFIDDLEELDSYIRDQLSKVTSRSFMVFHPSWGYYADEYGLKQVPIELEGKQPRAKSLSQLISLAQQNNIKAVFVQKQFSVRDAKTIADQIGARIVVVDPLAEDYIENLRKTTALFVEALT